MAESRRIRVGRSVPTTIPKSDAVRMDELLATLCKNEHKLKSIANQQTEASAELFALMKTYKKTELRNTFGEADIVTPAGRKSTLIDPKKFFKKVPEADFFDSITVGVTAAKKVLSEKEIASISTVTPAVAGDPKLVIKPV